MWRVILINVDTLRFTIQRPAFDSPVDARLWISENHNVVMRHEKIVIANELR